MSTARFDCGDRVRIAENYHWARQNLSREIRHWAGTSDSRFLWELEMVCDGKFFSLESQFDILPSNAHACFHDRALAPSQEIRMVNMWLGYMWGEFSSFTVSWERPSLISADSSIFTFDTRNSQSNVPPMVIAWIRSVTVKDPSTGAITVKESNAAVPVRIEDNAIAVTFSFGSTGCFDAEALLHVHFWS